MTTETIPTLQIKNRWTDAVIYEAPVESMRALLLAGKEGYALEKKHGWNLAANMIWHKAHKGPRPSFYGSNERAIESLQKCAQDGLGK